jgi:hypothetical protein
MPARIRDLPVAFSTALIPPSPIASASALWAHKRTFLLMDVHVAVSPSGHPSVVSTATRRLRYGL